MIKVSKYFPAFLLLPALAFWVSCSQQRQLCLTPKTASLTMEMMHKANDTTTLFTDTALPSAVFIPLTDNPAKRNAFVYTRGSSFAVSLSPDTTMCMWLFATDTVSYQSKTIDTITFYYARQLQFLSNACGYTYFYTLDSVHTSHLMIDSLHIINTSVTNNVNTKHLQVYIHPGF